METLANFKTDVERVFALKREAEALELVFEAKKKELETLKAEVLGKLEQHGLENFKVPGLGMIGTRNNFAVSAPKDPEAKAAFKAWLDARGMSDLLSINYQTLNGLYKEQLEKAVEAGDSDFAIPGVGEAKHYKTLFLKKG